MHLRYLEHTKSVSYVLRYKYKSTTLYWILGLDKLVEQINSNKVILTLVEEMKYSLLNQRDEIIEI